MNDNSQPFGGLDNSFQQFFEQETVRQKFQTITHELTDQCWDLCMEKPSNRLDSRTENCLVNCVNRFVDTSLHIISRLDKKHLSSTATSSFD